MADAKLTVRVEIENVKAVRAFANVVDYINELAEGREWDSDLARIRKMARYAARNLTVRQVR